MKMKTIVCHCGYCVGIYISDCYYILDTLAPPPVFKKRKLGKNPNVDTSFLPDRDREVSVVIM